MLHAERGACCPRRSGQVELAWCLPKRPSHKAVRNALQEQHLEVVPLGYQPWFVPLLFVVSLLFRSRNLTADFVLEVFPTRQREGSSKLHNSMVKAVEGMWNAPNTAPRHPKL